MQKKINSYDIILDSLMKNGYEETEAEELIAEVIEDQYFFDAVAKVTHYLYMEEAKPKKYS